MKPCWKEKHMRIHTISGNQWAVAGHLDQKFRIV